VAGTGSSVVASNELHQSWGIFLDTNFDLYVADAAKNRIQLFRPGQLNGTTVAANKIPQNLRLNFPTDVILDADNHHGCVIRSGHGGFQCVIGCSVNRGSTQNELHNAYNLRFDSQGNIYVADEYKNRIQKFTLGTNSCSKCDRKLWVKIHCQTNF
jgi:hypothetical protein